MAGMLPGVEFARRRRLHPSGGLWSSDTPSAAAYGSVRRSSACTTFSRSHESHHSSSLAHEDGKLGGVAGEAKERLDERLRTQRKSDTRSRHLLHEDGIAGDEQLRREVYGGGGNGLITKKSKNGSRRYFSWAKLRWEEALDHDECAICLDRFRTGQTLVHLRCAHRFHSICLVPWLHTHSLCPCCRMPVTVPTS